MSPPSAATPHLPATADEELLCCLGPGLPGFAADDPDRVARMRDQVTYGFARWPFIRCASAFVVFPAASAPSMNSSRR